MPARCVAGFCSNTRQECFSLSKFPKDEQLRTKWVRQVRRTRDLWSPSSTSVLCCSPFTDDCFDLVPSLKQEMGLSVQHKRILLPTTVPTVFSRSTSTTRPTPQAFSCSSSSTSATQSQSSAIYDNMATHSHTPRSCVVKSQRREVS